MNYENMLNAVSAQQAFITDTLNVLFPLAEEEVLKKLSDGAVLMLQNLLCVTSSAFESATGHVFELILDCFPNLNTSLSLDEVLALFDTTMQDACAAADLIMTKPQEPSDFVKLVAGRDTTTALH